MNEGDDRLTHLRLEPEPNGKDALQVRRNAQVGRLTGRVTRSNVDADAPLVVSLMSSDTTEAVVPSTVTIPAFALFATFTLSAVDDALADTAQPVTVSAFTTGYVSSPGAIEVRANPHPWQNPYRAFDVDGDGTIAPLDALLVINHLNASGVGMLAAPSISQPPFIDPSGDNFVAPLDALLVINYLNAGGNGEAPDRDPPTMPLEESTDFAALLWLLASDAESDRVRPRR